MSGVKIHDTLTVDDLFRAADLIAAVLSQVDESTIDKLTKIRKPKDGDGEEESQEERERRKSEMADLGRTLISMALRIAPDSGRRFMAGLVDMDATEFGALPMGSVLDIVEQMKDREDIRDFFGRAADLAKSFESMAPKKAAPASSTGA